MPLAYIGLGSNIDPRMNLRRALELLAARATLRAISTIYESPAIGRPEQQPFWNGVAAVDADRPAHELKWDLLRGIEAELGRQRSADKYAPRPIDLDLLLCGQQISSDPDLILPDPDIRTRAFIAIPLFELDGSLVLPGSAEPLADIVRRLINEPMRGLGEYTLELRHWLSAGKS